jgi:hypothetical protein
MINDVERATVEFVNLLADKVSAYPPPPRGSSEFDPRRGVQRRPPRLARGERCRARGFRRWADARSDGAGRGCGRAAAGARPEGREHLAIGRAVRVLLAQLQDDRRQAAVDRAAIAGRVDIRSRPIAGQARAVREKEGYSTKPRDR